MKVSIVGVTGYSGLELVRILYSHPKVSLVSIYASKEIGRPLSSLYPHLKGICDLTIQELDAQQIMKDADLVFFATPSGIAKDLSKDFVEVGFPVIDLSGDHRLPAESYEKWYKKTPADQTILDEFTYGLAEFHDVAGKKFISNPGCYATATSLALIPLVKKDLIDTDSIIVDAKSGLSGAGKGLSDSSHFVNVHDNYVTYKLNQHQHIPEIVQELKKHNDQVKHIQFSTSLLPVNRGIVATCYAKVKKGVTEAELKAAFEATYNGKTFVRLTDGLPDLHAVVGSNFTDIGLVYNEVTGIVTVVSVIDNLVKGAAGQAVQNLNLMNGWREDEGFALVPSFL